LCAERLSPAVLFRVIRGRHNGRNVSSLRPLSCVFAGEGRNLARKFESCHVPGGILILRRLPGLRLALPADQLAYNRDNIVYGLRALPVTWA
jgi:hypothetical protein